MPVDSESQKSGKTVSGLGQSCSDLEKEGNCSSTKMSSFMLLIGNLHLGDNEV